MKLLLTCILICVTITCTGQIKINSGFELGYEKFYISIPDPTWNTPIIYSSPKLITGTYELVIKYKNFSFVNSAKSYFNNFKETSFSIYFIDYTTELYYTKSYNNIRFKIGYLHNCFHPIVKTSGDEVLHRVLGGKDKIYIKINI